MPAGWTLLEASGVSADGRTIVGTGINPDGNREAWMVTLDNVPEPSALVSIGSLLGGLAVTAGWYRRRKPA